MAVIISFRPSVGFDIKQLPSSRGSEVVAILSLVFVKSSGCRRTCGRQRCVSSCMVIRRSPRPLPQSVPQLTPATAATHVRWAFGALMTYRVFCVPTLRHMYPWDKGEILKTSQDRGNRDRPTTRLSRTKKPRYHFRYSFNGSVSGRR